MAKIVKRRGKWVCDYYDPEGIRKRPSFSTKPEAEEFKREFILRTIGLDKSKRINVLIKVSEAIRKYYDSVSINKSIHSIHSEKKYFETLYDYLFDEKEIMYLKDVELCHIESLQNHLRKRVSGATVNRYFNTYKHFFNKCYQWGLIAKNPCEQIKRMSEDPKHRKLWSFEQMENVINECPKWAGDVLFFIACTAARSGEEVKRLTWNDVDFESSFIRLKTYKGSGQARSRFVPMTENLKGFLLEKKDTAKKLFRARDTDHVFFNSRGNLVESDVLDKVVRRACEKLGYEGLTPYGLRHKALTDLALSNESIEKIRMIAGHSSLTTTQKYLKLCVDELKGPLERITSKGLIRAVSNGH